MDMNGKVVVVTGAFGALGSTVARAFARHGAQVALLDLAQDPPPVLQAEFMAGHLLIGGVDLGDVESTRRAMLAAAMRLGGMDVLVNVAGGFQWQTLADGDVETWDQLYRMNLRTAVVSCKQALPSCSSADGAASSTSARAPLPRAPVPAWARTPRRRPGCRS